MIQVLRDAITKYMMRIVELLEVITSSGSLSPSAYEPVALQRDATHRQKKNQAKQERDLEQQAAQQRVASRRPRRKIKRSIYQKRRSAGRKN